MNVNKKHMHEALRLAEIAASIGEVPVGAVIVKGDEIIASAYNKRETGDDATAHAEVLAIREACQKLGTWRLSGCDLYVTLEPCPMCAGAIVNARVDRVFFGAKDARGGALGSVLDIRSYPLFSKPAVYSGVCEPQCKELLQNFFKKRR